MATILISYRLCLVVIIAVPIATPSEFKNDASFVFTRLVNRKPVFT